jgi:TerC family integral membrane protein
VIAIDSQALWSGFIVLIVLSLAVDLALHRRPRPIELREASGWTAGWVLLGLSFAAVVWLALGGEATQQYLASYLIEWTLSVDNVFVFVLVIAGLGVPPALRHRVLLVGAVGAILMRLVFILAGTALLREFEWLSYLFGAVLLVAAVRFLRHREGPEPGGRTAGLVRRLLPVAEGYDGERLTTVAGGRRLATPLLLALVLVTATDVVFAVDSIPAVFGITRDPFIAFTSNALAVLGLRSLYFLVEGAVGRIRYLTPALAFLLAFVGAKMLAGPLVEVSVQVSLAVIVATLAVAGLASWAADRRQSAGVVRQ